MMLEKIWRISGSPSRYQIGVDRYIGGQMKKSTVGRAAQAVASLEWKLVKAGSTFRAKVDEPTRFVKKFVRQATMQMSDSGRIDFNDVEKTDRRPHWSNCAEDIQGRSRQLWRDMCLLMLESPTTV